MELLPGSSPELLPESSLKEMRSTTPLLLGSSPEESALTSMHVDRFLLHVQEKTLPLHWRASLESTNLAIARVYGFLYKASEELASSMENRGRRTGAIRWNVYSPSQRKLTLLAGVADSTEEDGRGRGRRASSM
jgi:hypothetical protein